MGETLRGEPDGRDLRLVVVVARFNEFATERLLEGAREALEQHTGGAGRVQIVQVPGAFELPLAARRLASSGNYDAVVCLGAVIRGETAHFDYVAGQAAAGIQQVMLETGVPVAFGVVTTNTVEQALARAGGRIGNKGFEAVMTAIEMANLLRKLKDPGGVRGIQGGNRGAT